jgi:hypothetical protein
VSGDRGQGPGSPTQASAHRPAATAARREDCRETLLTNAEGELLDLIDEFSDGRIQFAFVKVKDPNSSLPKNVLIAWVCLVNAR